jgi:hypothetical protein
MPTSKVHRKLAQSFYLHTSRYNRISAEEISVGRRAFGEIYARIIQRAYRRYKKKPASLAKCAWNAIRYYDNREELRHFSSRYFQSDDKRGLYHFQLAISAVTLLLNVLFQKGYIMLNWPPWILLP